MKKHTARSYSRSLFSFLKNNQMSSKRAESFWYFQKPHNVFALFKAPGF